jgi:potassium efflux system protein
VAGSGAQCRSRVAALSVGLGFGLQEIVANFVSGLVILFERPVRVGDTVTVGQLTGTVSRVRIRATTITDWDRKEIIVPNKSFITEHRSPESSFRSAFRMGPTCNSPIA